MGTHDRHGPLGGFAVAGLNQPHFATRTEADLVRRYEVSGIDPDGNDTHFVRALPAEPHIDEAFAAFSHGTLITTPHGPVAVEDLVPGMQVSTVDAGPRMLMWVGSTVLTPLPDALRADVAMLTRVTADALGLGRPMPDLILGPRARMLLRHPGCLAMLGTEAAFAPASAFVDGVSMIGLHAARPTRVFHLALTGQHILIANGVEVESFHPGESAHHLMDLPSRERFLSLFPHLDGFEGFGAMPLPRLTAFELGQMRAA